MYFNPCFLILELPVLLACGSTRLTSVPSTWGTTVFSAALCILFPLTCFFFWFGFVSSWDTFDDTYLTTHWKLDTYKPIELWSDLKAKIRIEARWFCNVKNRPGRNRISTTQSNRYCLQRFRKLLPRIVWVFLVTCCHLLLLSFSTSSPYHPPTYTHKFTCLFFSFPPPHEEAACCSTLKAFLHLVAVSLTCRSWTFFLSLFWVSVRLACLDSNRKWPHWWCGQGKVAFKALTAFLWMGWVNCVIITLLTGINKLKDIKIVFRITFFTFEASQRSGNYWSGIKVSPALVAH